MSGAAARTGDFSKKENVNIKRKITGRIGNTIKTTRRKETIRLPYGSLEKMRKYRIFAIWKVRCITE